MILPRYWRGWRVERASAPHNGSLEAYRYGTRLCAATWLELVQMIERREATINASRR